MIRRGRFYPWDHARPYRNTSLVRKYLLLGPYSRAVPRALWCSCGGVLFPVSEVPVSGRIPNAIFHAEIASRHKNM